MILFLWIIFVLGSISAIFGIYCERRFMREFSIKYPHGFMEIYKRRDPFIKTHMGNVIGVDNRVIIKENKFKIYSYGGVRKLAGVTLLFLNARYYFTAVAAILVVANFIFSVFAEK